MATPVMMGNQPMRCACIDIGSNTTRVLVAEVAGGRLSEVSCEKAFTRLGSVLRRTGALPPAAIDDVAGLVAAQSAHAREAGCERIRVVATAAIRAAANADALLTAVRERSGHEVDIVGAEEEARLAFAGATHTHPRPLPGRIAVVDVGGGSSEIATGTFEGGVEWSISVPLGSSSLADACLHGDPPAAAELQAAADDAAAAFAAVDPPKVDIALAVGGSATSMARLVGAAIAPAPLARALAILSGAPRAEVALANALEPERVRLLPAGLHILGAVSERLGLPLIVGRGGLREGVCLDLAR
jgi:exopolyphosphatase/guanosine-5'-triphosphate,3'-diphosphate pyrophosphatase